MNQKISAWLFKISTGKMTLLALLFFILFSIIFLPGQSSLTESYSQGMGSPDTSLFYTPANLYQMAEKYGEAGRSAYVQARYTFDLAFPIVYTFFLATSLSWFGKHVLSEKNEFRSVNLIPLYAMLFDFFENICTALVFTRYPGTSSVLASLAPFFTLVKWIYVSSAFVFLFIFAIWYLVKQISSKRKERK